MISCCLFMYNQIQCTFLMASELLRFINTVCCPEINFTPGDFFTGNSCVDCLFLTLLCRPSWSPLCVLKHLCIWIPFPSFLDLFWEWYVINTEFLYVLKCIYFNLSLISVWVYTGQSDLGSPLVETLFSQVALVCVKWTKVPSTVDRLPQTHHCKPDPFHFLVPRSRVNTTS